MKKIMAILLSTILVTSVVPILTQASGEFDAIYDPYLSVYYGFENSANARSFIEGVDNTATLVNNSLSGISGAVQYTSHEGFGSAVNFDQTYGLSLGKNIVTGNQFTIAFWIKPDYTVPWRSAFSAYGNDNLYSDGLYYDTRMNFCPNGSASAYTGGAFEWKMDGNADGNWGSQYIATTTEQILVNRWSHVAIVGNVDTYTIYLDGVVVFERANEDPNNSFNFSDIWVSNAINFYLGVSTHGADAGFSGAVDEFYGFNRILSGSDINLLMQYHPTPPSFKPKMDSSLSTYYGFEDNVNAVAKGDAIGNSTSVLDNSRNINSTSTIQYLSHQNYGKAVYFDQTYGLGLGKNIVAGNQFTISFWFKPDVVVPYRSLFSAYGTGTFPWDGLYYDNFMNLCPGGSSNSFQWRMVGGPSWYFNYIADAPVTISANVWSHVAIVGNVDTYSMYIDGVKVFDKTNETAQEIANGPRFINSWAKNTVDFFLGISTHGADAPFNGAIDEFYSFNRSLSNEEIIFLKNYDATSVGDVNDDNIIDILDLATAKNILLKKETLLAVYKLDMNYNDKITITDLIILKRKIIGLI
jgi:hypothetical protein